MNYRAAGTARALAAAVALLTVVLPSAKAAGYEVLYYFTGQADGGNPYGIVRQKNGTIYGYALGGNTDCVYLPSCGVVFGLDRPGKETVLYSFTGGDDGAGPSGNLIEDENGNLYGMTLYGGGGQCKIERTVVGCGTVFKLKPPKVKGGMWRETVLYRFQGIDGSWPMAGLARDATGNLYGTTERAPPMGRCSR